MEAPDIKSTIVEAKWNVKEAIRLFEIESQTTLLHESQSHVMNTNTSRTNIGWIRTHLSRIINNLNDLEIADLKWAVLRENLQTAATENVAIKRAYLDEKRRTSSLYHSLHETIVSLQLKEAELGDWKNKHKALQKEYRKLSQLQKTGVNAGLHQVESRIQNVKKHKANKTNISNSSSSASGGIQQRQLQEDGQPVAKKLKTSHVSAPDNSAVGFTSQMASLSPPSSSSAGSGKDLTSNGNANASANGVVKRANQGQQSNTRHELLLNRKVSKLFEGHGLFEGSVTGYKAPYFRVTYTDGDSEEMTETELRKHLMPE
jgi:hypothetical protein